MVYTVLNEDGSEREIEAPDLADLVAGIGQSFRSISVGSGVQRLTVLSPLRPLPDAWTAKDMPRCSGGDSVRLVRLLIKEGLVTGKAKLWSVEVEAESLVEWAEARARACHAECLLLWPQMDADTTGKGEDCWNEHEEPPPKEERVIRQPVLPEYAWTDEQLGVLWTYGVVPCGGDEILFLFTPLQWFPECQVDGDTLSQLLGVSAAVVPLDPDPDRHCELAVTWWDRFWQCDEKRYAARTFAGPVTQVTTDWDDGCFAELLVREASGTILNREDFFAVGRMVSAASGSGLSLRSASMWLVSFLDHAGGHALISVERQASGANLAVAKLGPDGKETSRELLFLCPVPGRYAWELLLDMSVLAGLSLRGWEEEADALVPVYGTACVEVHARRSLAGVYGPVLELRWSPLRGSVALSSPPVAEPRGQHRFAALDRTADWLGRHGVWWLLAGILLIGIAFATPGGGGFIVGMALAWLGGSACACEPRRREPGAWMLSGLFLAWSLFMFGAVLLGVGRDTLSHPELRWKELAEEGLMLLIMLLTCFLLACRTAQSLRRDRSALRAVRACRR